MDKKKIKNLENALKSAYNQMEADTNFPSSENWKDNIMDSVRAFPRASANSDIVYEQFLLKTAWGALGVAAALAVILIMTFFLIFSRQSYSLEALINNKSIQISYGQFANYDSGGA